MSVELSTGLRNGMLNGTGIKEAFANGVMYLYSGPQPDSADDAVQGTLLMKITVAAGAFVFGTATNGINFDAPASGVLPKAAAENWQGAGITDGTIGWFRLMGNGADALGVSTTLPRLDGSVATSGGDLNLTSTDVTTGSPLTIDVFQLTQPASE